ncbi:hypothetical protein TcWFU_010145 [Taenia crassiceps]|uniref:Uncharacterized protein n=1 Tax=Taenia crassiceps TaxID=6207 RepID=A0ABR4QU47_9CEST
MPLLQLFLEDEEFEGSVDEHVIPTERLVTALKNADEFDGITAIIYQRIKPRTSRFHVCGYGVLVAGLMAN